MSDKQLGVIKEEEPRAKRQLHKRAASRASSADAGAGDQTHLVEEPIDEVGADLAVLAEYEVPNLSKYSLIEPRKESGNQVVKLTEKNLEVFNRNIKKTDLDLDWRSDNGSLKDEGKERKGPKSHTS